MVQTSIKDEELKPKSKLSFKSEDEYVNSEEGIEIDGAEFVGQKAEEKAESKLKEKKTRNGLKQKSSAAEKLTDKDGNSVLCFDVNAATDRKLTNGEKKLKRRIRKDEKRVFKLQKRLDKAEDNLPHQRVFHVRKEWNSEKQKMQRKLRLEKGVKPLPKPNIVQKGVQSAKHAVTTTVSGITHQQISKYEDDNQTLKSAHGTEKVAESALRFASNKVKTTNQKLKEKPYKKASKLKFDTENAHKKLNQHKVALEHKTEQQSKKEAKKALKKAQQKRNQKNAAKTAKKGASKAGKKAGEAAKDVGQIIVKAVANNKVVIIILIIFLLLFGLLFTLGSSAFTSLGDTGTMVIASSYTSDEEDIYAANDYMNALENNLNYEISNIPNVYVGWNEYNYYIDPIGHKRACYIHFESCRNTLSFRLGLFKHKVVQILQDRHFSRIGICKVITINHSHATVDNGLFDRFKSVLAADNQLTKGEDKVCLQCDRAFVLGVVEVDVKRIDILCGSRRNLDNLTVKTVDKRIILGFGVADDNIVCCGKKSVCNLTLCGE